MSQATFYIVIILAVIYAGFTVSETWMYQRWELASAEQREVQSKLAYAQRLKNFTDQFLRRLAIDSQHDPALADLLKKHNIKVVVSNLGPAVDASQAQAVPGPPTLPNITDKTASPPAASPALSPTLVAPPQPAVKP